MDMKPVIVRALMASAGLPVEQQADKILSYMEVANALSDLVVTSEVRTQPVVAVEIPKPTPVEESPKEIPLEDAPVLPQRIGAKRPPNAVARTPEQIEDEIWKVVPQEMELDHNGSKIKLTAGIEPDEQKRQVVLRFFIGGLPPEHALPVYFSGYDEDLDIRGKVERTLKAFKESLNKAA